MPDTPPSLQTPLGRVSISREAVAQIVGHTVAECYGVVGTAPAARAPARVRRLLARARPKETQVELPSYVPNDFEVFVNGVRQARGVDYEVIGRSLAFPRPIEQEGRLGFWRWLSLFLGVAGTYRKNDTVDVVYTLNGRRTVATLHAERPSSSA